MAREDWWKVARGKLKCSAVLTFASLLPVKGDRVQITMCSSNLSPVTPK